VIASSASIVATSSRRRSPSTTIPAGEHQERARGEGKLVAVDLRRGLLDDRGRVAEAVDDVARPARGERRQHRETHGATDLLRRVQQAGREAGVSRRDVRRRDQRQRHEDEAHADRHQHEAGQQVGQIGAVRGHAPE